MRTQPPHGFPPSWIVFWAALAINTNTPCLDVIDAFSGPCANLAHACYEQGLNAMPFDRLRHALYENCLTMEGQQYFLTMLGRMPRGSLCFLGPPCNSWITSSQSFYKRSKTRIAGDQTKPEVLQWNQVADFVGKVLECCIALGIYFVVEQPVSSLLFEWPPIATALLHGHARRISFSLAKFGAASLKPLQLYSNVPWLYTLEAIAGATSIPSSLVSLASSSAGGSWTGNKSAMAESATYPPTFCTVIAKLQHSLKQEEASSERLRNYSVVNREPLHAAWLKRAIADDFFPEGKRARK
mmetsp:Transcript_155014/g.269612  ORF Transcript_155014/g.269612 Transcript_155014/m.269612 type:complete len:298 (-) Transcript_155014:52-945(-)